MLNEQHDLELRGWIYAATDGLCDVAVLRVYKEIQAHYAEAVAVHTDEGLSEEEAHRAAIAALGDAERARRAFRKAYLTEKQAKRLLKNTKHAGGMLLMLFVFALFSVAEGWGFVSELLEGGLSEWRLRMLPVFSALMVSVFVSCWLCPSLAGQRQWRRTLVWDIVAQSLLYSALACMQLAEGGVENGRLLFLIVLCYPVSIFPEVSMLRKLGKHVDLYDSFADKHDGGRYA